MSNTRHRLPSLTSLAAFEAAAASLSFKQAAAELNVTPAAVSRQIRNLESELGCSLFLRLHRRVALTDDGEVLFAGVSGAFEALAGTVANFRNTGQRQVTVASTSAVATLWLMPRLARFWEERPDVNVHHFVTEQPVDLDRDRADLAIRFGSGHWSGVEARALFTDRIYPLCSPEYLKRHGPFDDPRRLAEQTLIQVVGVPGDDWTGWPEMLNHLGLGRPTVRVRHLNNYVATVQAALADQGVIIGWDSQVREHVADGRLVRPVAAEMPAPGGYYLLTRRHGTLSMEVRQFVDWLVREASRGQ